MAISNDAKRVLREEIRSLEKNKKGWELKLNKIDRERNTILSRISNIQNKVTILRGDMIGS